MLLLTTLDAWLAAPRSAPFVLGENGAAWAPGDDDQAALAIADDAFPAGQVVALTLDPEPRRVPLPGVIDRSAVARVRYARRGPAGRHVALLDRPAVAAALDLLPHPEGGWFRETWRTSSRFRPDGRGERAAATAIYFLLPPGEESVWHTVSSDELWLWHRGGPLALTLGGRGGRPGPAEDTITVGPDVEHGQHPQALVPRGTWQSARPAAGEAVLVTCVVSPGFDFADFRAL
ncbi:MAG TPA: cupin domain-containing protein [Streptosporangiaceae bacterium]